MAYDKMSFLSGVAAGRNMESWPAFEGEETPGIFSYIITIDGSSRGYDAPSWVVGFLTGGQIFWGDGETDTIAATSTIQRYSHRYQSKGIFTVTIIGASEFRRAPGAWLTKVITPFPPAVVNVQNMFYQCYYLETIPDGLLMNAEGDLYNYESFMSWCLSLQAIPEDLFAYHDPIYINDAFSNAGQWYYSLTGEMIEMPAGLLRDCASLSDASRAFADCYFDEIPVGFLDDCVALRYATSMFANNHGTVIPEGLFDYCVNLRYASWIFFNSTRIEAIPEDLFDNCPDIVEFESAFERCQSVIGRVPELWISHPNANGTECFADMTASQISNYADIPSEWK